MPARSGKTPGAKRAAAGARAPRETSAAARHVAAAAPAADAGREEAVALDFLPARPSVTSRSGPRHAVFIDVENTSSEVDLVRVLEDLDINRATTELTAVGNWRVVGQQLGRMLAQRGAHLVHSAPAPRVPDWSDLWIAVTAGMWLGRAAPGDALDILSDDRAFDAVGDAAARLGVRFRRITYRTAGALAERATAEDGGGGKRRRRRRRHGESSGQAAHPPTSHAQHASHPSPSLASEDERHAASLEQIRAAIARLTASDPPRGVSLDMLTLALKAEGFQRPPGSPRLVTRLRRIKDVEMLPNGRVRLVGEAAELVSAAVEGTYETPPAATSDVAPRSGDSAASVDEAPSAAPTGKTTKRRSRRRGGRGRRGGRRRAATAAPESAG